MLDCVHTDTPCATVLALRPLIAGIPAMITQFQAFSFAVERDSRPLRLASVP